MERYAAVVEYWTATRRGLVLTGPREAIGSIAGVLQLPPDAPVEITPATATLALWGETLESYTRAFAHRRQFDAAE